MTSARPVRLRSRRNKFGVAPKAERTLDGIVFQSKREMKRYAELKMLQDAGKITGLRCQVPYMLHVGSVDIAKYIADFCYRTLPDCAFHVEDAKGFRTPEYKLKKRLMLACHGIEIEEV